MNGKVSFLLSSIFIILHLLGERCGMQTLYMHIYISIKKRILPGHLGNEKQVECRVRFEEVCALTH